MCREEIQEYKDGRQVQSSQDRHRSRHFVVFDCTVRDKHACSGADQVYTNAMPGICVGTAGECIVAAGRCGRPLG